MRGILTVSVISCGCNCLQSEPSLTENLSECDSWATISYTQQNTN